jgi:hypothetical protein
MQPHSARTAPLVIGLDVGSTTVVDPGTKTVLWRDYDRHHTRQPETVLDFLRRIREMQQTQLAERHGRLDADLDRQIDEALTRMRAHEARIEKKVEPPKGMVTLQSLSLSKRASAGVVA